MAKWKGHIGIKRNRRYCYLCGGKVTWDSEDLVDEGRGYSFEVYLHCNVCRAMIQCIIPIKKEEMVKVNATINKQKKRMGLDG